MQTGNDDILLVWHPINIAAKIRAAIKGHSYRAAAAIMGVPNGDLMAAIEFPYDFGPRLAASLHKFNLDGRELFLRAQERRFEIERRYESGEMQRPDWDAFYEPSVDAEHRSEDAGVPPEREKVRV